MIISDGTTEVEVKFADEEYIPIIDKFTRISANGRTKSQTAGERMKFNVRIRATAAEWKSIKALLTNSADEYYYTAEETYSIFPDDVVFPIASNITIRSREWDNRSHYWIVMEVESVGYL